MIPIVWILQIFLLFINNLHKHLLIFLEEIVQLSFIHRFVILFFPFFSYLLNELFYVSFHLLFFSRTKRYKNIVNKSLLISKGLIHHIAHDCTLTIVIIGEERRKQYFLFIFPGNTILTLIIPTNIFGCEKIGFNWIKNFIYWFIVELSLNFIKRKRRNRKQAVWSSDKFDSVSEWLIWSLGYFWLIRYYS